MLKQHPSQCARNQSRGEGHRVRTALTGLELLKIIQREKIPSVGTEEEGKSRENLSVGAKQELALGATSINMFQSARNMES